MTLTVSNIPYARYSIYAYVGDSSLGTKKKRPSTARAITSPPRVRTPTTYTAITSTSSSNYQSGNYIEVDGLTGSSQTVTVAGTAQQYGGLCSVEIVNTTPASAASTCCRPRRRCRIAGRRAHWTSAAAASRWPRCRTRRPAAAAALSTAARAASVLTLSATGGSTTFSGTIRGGGTLARSGW